ncbi:hypothetical protein BC936DRAFT_146053 [Jimgerdemannia flammicorona]|uniref:Uncharacterized protein n=2 Tax=Jimgerdemannia flammicorona TaxID=994334 RepID=A0A433D976_9FUNG|nr:hypothetical protein BC936DRAFT_146053 [Jimgerdemannia flammicorona]RUS29921.1 hypothetical protein BC938DRAFT_480072 [Jimgerdemannia flammicorona]
MYDVVLELGGQPLATGDRFGFDLPGRWHRGKQEEHAKGIIEVADGIDMCYITNQPFQTCDPQEKSIRGTPTVL